MIAYVDSSVLLRVALAQPNALPEWRRIDRGVSSALITTESLRTLDRARLRAHLPDTEVALRRSTILALVDSLELVEVDAIVLDRAAQPMPTEWGLWMRFISHPHCFGEMRWASIHSWLLMTPPWGWPRRLMGSLSWGPIECRDRLHEEPPSSPVGPRARAFDFSARARIVARESRPGSRCLRQRWRERRKVRAPADRVPGNAWGA